MGIGARLKRSAQSEQAARVGRSAQETTRHAHHVRAESAAHAGFAQRRGLLGNAAALAFAPTLSALAWAGAPAAAPPRLLILLELRGGNDGLNTVVPVDDGSYYDLRPHLALRGDGVVRFAPDLALHSALAPWRTLWDAGEMAVIQGVGYPAPNLSHFRSIEIWDTASDSDRYLPSGWLTRASRGNATFQACSADGAIIGAADPGPLGGGARTVAGVVDLKRLPPPPEETASPLAWTTWRLAVMHTAQLTAAAPLSSAVANRSSGAGGSGGRDTSP